MQRVYVIIYTCRGRTSSYILAEGVRHHTYLQKVSLLRTLQTTHRCRYRRTDKPASGRGAVQRRRKRDCKDFGEHTKTKRNLIIRKKSKSFRFSLLLQVITKSTSNRRPTWCASNKRRMAFFSINKKIVKNFFFHDQRT